MINYMDNTELPPTWHEPHKWLMNNFDSIANICWILNFTETERKLLWNRATETENIELLLFLEIECIVNFKTNSQE